MRKHSILMPEKGLLYGYLTPLLTISLFVILIGLSVVSEWYRTQIDIGYLMADHITQLTGIFERIETTCNIIGFDSQKNPINFLTIKKGGFVGSELGSMNVAHPEKWEGPYLPDNPTMLGKEYQIVRTRKGYFITPGEGVRLPNGKIIGKDIILDEKADVASMMLDVNALRFKDRPLAAFLNINSFATRGVTAEDLVEMVQHIIKHECTTGCVRCSA